MGRKKGLDNRKIALILGALARNPDGIWLRRIAKEAGITPATVGHYIDTVLKPLVDDTTLGEAGKPFLRVIKLKPFVLERLEHGQDIKQLMKTLNLLQKIS